MIIRCCVFFIIIITTTAIMSGGTGLVSAVAAKQLRGRRSSPGFQNKMPLAFDF
jgi:hypothetical protein